MYRVGQYNKPPQNENHLMSFIDGTITIDVENVPIEGLEEENLAGQSLLVSNPLIRNQCYFLRLRIKKNSYTQNFNIYLIDSKDNTNSKKQFIKSILISNNISADISKDSGATYPADNILSNWIEINIVFSPLFDGADKLVISPTLSIDLIRAKEFATPYIIYEDFYKIENLLGSNNIPNKLLKIGVQSHPGLLMCINKDEIVMGHRGVYEFRNNKVKINYFSIIEKPLMSYDIYTFNRSGGSIINNIKTEGNKDEYYTTDSFILDYMYEMEENN